jgi:Sulfotransferase family
MLEQPSAADILRTHRLLFVGGLHRSGTTLLGRSLAQHPEISGFKDTGVSEDEGQHLQTIYRSALSHGGPGRFAFDPEAHLTESSDLVNAETRERLLRSWCTYWDVSRTLLLEKSPPNLIRTRFLQAVFPGASFVVIVRHPVAVALATRRFVRSRTAPARRLSDLLRHWVVAHRILLEDRQALERIAIVRYETFIARPTSLLASLQEWLGVEPYSRGTLEIDRGGNDTYFRTWQRPGRVWARNRARLDATFTASAEAFGYSMGDLTALHRPRLFDYHGE